ncbi:MAG: class I SAM-dependent methyltransferase [Candidatus Scalindua sp.]
MNWNEYFGSLAIENSAEHRKAGWGSKESQLSKFHAALNLIPEARDYSLLDLGCGTGVFEELLIERNPSLDIKAIDISKEPLRIAREKNLNVEFKIGSISDIPYKDSSFDIVTCIGVIQNFNGSLSTAITEMKRVLITGGLVILITMDFKYVGFKSGSKDRNPLNTYYIPEDLKLMFEAEGFLTESMFAIKTNEIGILLPLHQWHTFLISGRKT